MVSFFNRQRLPSDTAKLPAATLPELAAMPNGVIPALEITRLLPTIGNDHQELVHLMAELYRQQFKIDFSGVIERYATCPQRVPGQSINEILGTESLELIRIREIASLRYRQALFQNDAIIDYAVKVLTDVMMNRAAYDQSIERSAWEEFKGTTIQPQIPARLTLLKNPLKQLRSIDLDDLSAETQQLRRTLLADIFEKLEQAPVKIARFAQEQISLMHATVEQAPSPDVRLSPWGMRRGELRSHLDELRDTGKDLAAITQLICDRSHWMIVKLANKSLLPGGDLKDLIQAGYLALVYGIPLFDYRRGNKFSTYATYGIVRAMQYENQRHPTIRGPRSLACDLREYRQLVARLSHQLGRQPNAQEILEALGKKYPTPHILRIANQPLSANQSILHGQARNRLADIIPQPHDPRSFESQELAQNLQAALAALDDRQRLVITLRFGLGEDSKQWTLQQVAKRMRYTIETVRTLQNKALKKLRAALRKES
jgi:RNA polymerase primary sigma factor